MFKILAIILSVASIPINLLLDKSEKKYMILNIMWNIIAFLLWISILIKEE